MRCFTGLCRLFALIATAVIARGQQGTSTIVGAVTDPVDANIPNAVLQLTEQATGNVHNLVTPTTGLFRFIDLPPGKYALRIEAQGFKLYAVNGIELSSSETRDLGKLVLEVGVVTESVNVAAQSTPVQTASSERSASVLPQQLQDLSLKGRDPFGMMQPLPGVTDIKIGNRDLENAYSMGNISINGMSPQSVNVAVDGVTEMDEGGNYTAFVTPNMDSIAGMRVLTNGYQAEYGRQSGGTMNVITKNGGRDFHGSGHWDHRHEDLNANNFFNNRQGIARPLYRYMIAGYSLGGPVYIPRKWNTERRRLFFPSQCVRPMKSGAPGNSESSQFSDGFSVPSTTIISTGPFVGCSFSPSCSCTAVNTDGPVNPTSSRNESSIDGELSPGWSCAHSSLKSYSPFSWVLSTTGRSIYSASLSANLGMDVLVASILAFPEPAVDLRIGWSSPL